MNHVYRRLAALRENRTGDNRHAGRTVTRVSAEEHMANYRAAVALMGKGRNAGEGAAGLSRKGLRSQTAGLSKTSAKKVAKKSAVKKARPKK